MRGGGKCGMRISDHYAAGRSDDRLTTNEAPGFPIPAPPPGPLSRTILPAAATCPITMAV